MNDNTEDRLLQLIKKEDDKNPYTDEELAGQLGISRKTVIDVRERVGIADSRERRKKRLLSDIQDLLIREPLLSDRKLTERLNTMGYKISRFAVASQRPLHEDVLQSAQIKTPEIEVTEDTIFQDLIGTDGSLSMQVSQAKAAVIYPPCGLHTLILGPPGTGKSHLAELIHQFAVQKGCFKKNAPFYVFNCADYSDNPHLLLDQLFGHAKGAFTGADNVKNGIVEKAAGGILFLDEVHRLPKEGQELLFYLIDKGKYRRMGETDGARTAQVMLITATTEDPESHLLLTFRRRIPMVIEMPPLRQRPLKERYQIIRMFFEKESLRVNKELAVPSELMLKLMTYNCRGNIGQLRSDIQVACARAFLSCMEGRRMIIQEEHLPEHMKRATGNYPPSVLPFNKTLVITADQETGEDSFQTKEDIYTFIERRALELAQTGLKKEELFRILGDETEQEITRLYVEQDRQANDSLDRERLKEIAGEDLVVLIEEVLADVKKEMSFLSNKVLYPLSMHIKGAYERAIRGESTSLTYLEQNTAEYTTELPWAKELLVRINQALDVTIPEDELIFIAMYLRAFSSRNCTDETYVGVIVAAHGRVATGMAAVANRILGVEHCVGLDMDIDDSISIMEDRMTEAVKIQNQGKGCLILADMGSLLYLGDIISEKTGISTKTLGRVDTYMVIEVLRKALIPSISMGEIVDTMTPRTNLRQGVPNDVPDKKAVVCTCITGDGTAVLVRNYLAGKLEKNELALFSVGAIDQKTMRQEINEIMSGYEIVAFAGSVNPEFQSIPFHPVSVILKQRDSESLRKLLHLESHGRTDLSELFQGDLIFCGIEAESKNDILDLLAEALHKTGCVTEDFHLSIYKRELFAPTLYQSAIAIPHGDPAYVTKPAIAVGLLKQPVLWDDENVTDLVFMIAFQETSMVYFEALYKLISQLEHLEILRKSSSVSEFLHCLNELTLLF